MRQNDVKGDVLTPDEHLNISRDQYWHGYNLEENKLMFMALFTDPKVHQAYKDCLQKVKPDIVLADTISYFG